MKNFKLLSLFTLLLSFNTLNAELSISEEEYLKISTEISQLSESELIDREKEVKLEIDDLLTEQENTQSPSKRKN